MSTRFLDLYHRTTPENAARILATRRMVSKENTGDAFFSNRPDADAVLGYGESLVHIYIPEGLADLDDEFPDGERHYRVHVSALLPEHFITGR